MDSSPLPDNKQEQLTSYLNRIGYHPIHPETVKQAMERFRSYPAIAKHLALEENLASDQSNNAAQMMFDSCYSTIIPELNITLAEMMTRSARFTYEFDSLPAISDLCVKASKILEVGCGEGLLPTYIASCYPNAHIVALDILTSAIELTKEKIKKLGLTNITLIQDSLFNLIPTWHGQFDLVLLRRVIGENIFWLNFPDVNCYQLSQQLHCISHVLSRNGRIIFSVSLDRHTHNDSVRPFEDVVDNAGLTIESRVSIPFHFAYSPELSYHVAWTLVKQ